MSVRSFTPADAEDVTRLLHAAYREHDEAGLNFTAATQSVQVTQARAANGGCWVVELQGRIVATATVSVPPSHALQRLTPVAAAANTAWLNQFAVSPDHRGGGFASLLFRHGLDWAREQGMSTMGIDTAQPATDLISLYRHWGFEHRDLIRWEGKTYDSVVMSRPV